MVVLPEIGPFIRPLGAESQAATSQLTKRGDITSLRRLFARQLGFLAILQQLAKKPHGLRI
jgi:hypothetical protein